MQLRYVSQQSCQNCDMAIWRNRDIARWRNPSRRLRRIGQNGINSPQFRVTGDNVQFARNFPNGVFKLSVGGLWALSSIHLLSHPTTPRSLFPISRLNSSKAKQSKSPTLQDPRLFDWQRCSVQTSPWQYGCNHSQSTHPGGSVWSRDHRVFLAY